MQPSFLCCCVLSTINKDIMMMMMIVFAGSDLDVVDVLQAAFLAYVHRWSVAAVSI